MCHVIYIKMFELTNVLRKTEKKLSDINFIWRRAQNFLFC